MTTIQDIADRLGVSKSTVSKALNKAPDISEALQKQVLETAVSLGYTKLRRYKNTAKKLCIFIQSDNIEYTDPTHFGYDIVMGFRKMAEPSGFTVDVIPVDKTFQRSSSYETYMLGNNYAGSFVMGLSLSDPWMKDFQESRTPAVLFDNRIVGNPTIAYMGVDNEEGMELAVSHLRKLGHRKIGYLSSALGSFIMQARHRAFFRAMHINGLKAEPSYAGCSYYLAECMEKHLPRFLDMGMTAVICSHDTIASAAQIQCRQLGYRVPEDISFVGFDDVPISPYTSPPLTTVRQDRTELGKSAYYALDSLMNGVSIGTILLHAKLITRASTGPAAPRFPDASKASS